MYGTLLQNHHASTIKKSGKAALSGRASAILLVRKCLDEQLSNVAWKDRGPDRKQIVQDPLKAKCPTYIGQYCLYAGCIASIATENYRQSVVEVTFFDFCGFSALLTFCWRTGKDLFDLAEWSQRTHASTIFSTTTVLQLLWLFYSSILDVQ